MSNKETVRLNATNVRDFVGRYDTWMLDCDGVLWANDQFSKFEGVAGTIEKLRGLGKHLYFISNNTVQSAQSFVEKFQHMCGFEGRLSEVISINDVIATYLRDVAKVQGKVYVIGSRSTSDALVNGGLQPVGIGPSPEPLVEDLADKSGLPQLVTMALESDVKAVVVTLDSTFDFNKLFKAANYLRDPNCVFIAGSRDPFLGIGTADSRRRLPLNAALVAAVEAGTGRQATLLGKPSANFFASVKADHPDIVPERTIMVGDYLAADIRFAANCGIDSVLVESGVDNEHRLADALTRDPNTPKPSFILSSVADLGKWI